MPLVKCAPRRTPPSPKVRKSHFLLTKHTQQLSWLEVEGRLREWAETPGVLVREAQTLREAAETLTHWRAQEPGGNLP